MGSGHSGRSHLSQTLLSGWRAMLLDELCEPEPQSQPLMCSCLGIGSTMLWVNAGGTKRHPPQRGREGVQMVPLSPHKAAKSGMGLTSQAVSSHVEPY